jgi:hypothetical protein
MDLEYSSAVKAIEFESTLVGQDSIRIPGDIAHELPADSAVRVILLWETGDDAAWRELGAVRFAAAYAPEDDVYEELVNGPSRP